MSLWSGCYRRSGGYDSIGRAELAIAGGADAPITKHTFAAFAATGLSSCRNGEPEKASRPFDLERDSGVISEGAGMFVLENFERARARGARIYEERAVMRDDGIALQMSQHQALSMQ